ncbi:MAG: TRAP transporter fused permease subunit [Rhodospirillaceae bacterium]|nr:TRAP transporter fused permease subunit [Rhodospirillaceae bacterium]MCA8932424.1 TRAP transporter fused permease subunit [Rhodospirillaceae bacterium]
MLDRLSRVLAVLVGLFVLWTAGAGPFPSLMQRAIFVALVICLGLTLYPLGAGKRWRPLGVAIDLAMAGIAVAACVYIAIHHDEIMTSLPWATPLDMALIAGLTLTILEVSRRAVGIIFPTLVSLGLAYALLGHLLPSPLNHRAFDVYFVTETLYLGDLGVWGMLTGVAATVIAAFVLFGALLLHTGGGQAFMDLAMRLGGRSPGGAAKVATIASGLFGTISGSAVANVATTGNFTIPMMKRLGYPPAFAAAVEAVASTGGQIAPPIMGAAAFVMAEILGVSYVRVMVGAIIPALLFYLSVLVTVHIVSLHRGLRAAEEDELPAWMHILAPARSLPIVAAFAGLLVAVFSGRSVATGAFWGVMGLLGAYLVTNVGRTPARQILRCLVDGLADAGRGLVIIGVLLAGAQILVSMINMTGIGVVLSSMIVSLAGDSLFLVAVFVGIVCLVMGMGLPTTAAYVLVAAVLAPAMTTVGVDPLAAHMFVFYFATLSVITPPVCVAVFIGSGIAQTNWLPAAFESVRLAAVVYLVPFLLLIYPGMTWTGGWLEVVEAALTGAALVLAVPGLLGGLSLFGNRLVDIAVYLAAIALAVTPHWATPLLALGLMAWGFTRRRADARSTSRTVPEHAP